MKRTRDRITTTIEREWLAQIIAGSRIAGRWYCERHADEVERDAKIDDRFGVQVHKYGYACYQSQNVVVLLPELGYSNNA